MQQSAALYYTVRPALEAGIASATFWTLKDVEEARARCGGLTAWVVEAAHWYAEVGVYPGYLLQEGFDTSQQALDWVLDICPDASIDPRHDGLVVTPPNTEVLIAIARARPSLDTPLVAHLAREFHHAYPYEAEPFPAWQAACAGRLAAMLAKGTQ